MSATSSFNIGRRSGVRHNYLKVFVSGEGWVRWSDIEKQVAVKFAQWRMKKALAGILIVDGAELREMDIKTSKRHER